MSDYMHKHFTEEQLSFLKQKVDVYRLNTPFGASTVREDLLMNYARTDESELTQKVISLHDKSKKYKEELRTYYIALGFAIVLR